MIVVLPAPVAPTIATFSPGSTRNDTSLSTHSFALVGEPDVLELHPCRLERGASPAAARPLETNRTGRKASAPARSSTAGSVSSSWKMRSALAIEDCITEYLADRSRSGMKKRRSRSMKM